MSILRGQWYNNLFLLHSTHRYQLKISYKMLPPISLRIMEYRKEIVVASRFVFPLWEQMWGLIGIHYLMNIRDRCVHSACQLNELYHKNAHAQRGSLIMSRTCCTKVFFCAASSVVVSVIRNCPSGCAPRD